jgi:hypothetical protein
MSTLSLEVSYTSIKISLNNLTTLFYNFDKHVASLHSQLTFLNSALNATDHNAPD